MKRRGITTIEVIVCVFIFIALVGLIIGGINSVQKQNKQVEEVTCNTTDKEVRINVDYLDVMAKASVIELDGCEYITLTKYHGCAIIHKQNCKYCLNRKLEK